ncbi:MAG: tRNA (guanosine(37)-N1)-methyltransferase TrmD [Alphaproteobacteria bacterium]|nr:tRNA (guanosine(37)-N1)-methyltransferase TrmD [Alphaproteobacteria bacterium]
MNWRASVLTLFPEAFPGPLGVSLLEKARAEGIWSLETVDIRVFASDKHASVDDTPAGGGPGMVLRADVLSRAVDATRGAADARPLLYLSPRGTPLTQARVAEWSAGPGVVLLCGRFEGVDQRLLEARPFEEVSVGDVVLAGGEAAAVVLIEACVRLLPGVVGDPASLSSESFAGGLLEYPHYTRPQVWEGRAIPEVLQSGHHGEIAKWRQGQAERLTRDRRPDLWRAYLASRERLKDRD